LHWQSIIEYDPVTLLELLATQLVHTVLPAAEAYLPIPQNKHVLKSTALTLVEYSPTSQLIQEDEAIASNAVEYVPLMQLVHTLDPYPLWYFPSKQTVQTSTLNIPIPV
jgi:hypothetical protein